MVKIIVIAHNDIAIGFAKCAREILERSINNLYTIAINSTDNINVTLNNINTLLADFADDDQVLILTDIFGATPSNIASKLIKIGKIELITGLNLPMLIRALSYSNKTLQECINKALDGAISGIIHVD